jgi:CheY-like chemotaxis protein
MKVLIAEDHQLNQQLMAICMNKFGWEYTIVKNGQEAAEAYFLTNYDVVLMDLNMPVMDGFEATSFIRMIDSNAQIIAISAYFNEEIVDRCYQVGMCAIIDKPYTKAILYSTILASIQKVKVA